MGLRTHPTQGIYSMSLDSNHNNFVAVAEKVQARSDSTSDNTDKLATVNGVKKANDNADTRVEKDNISDAINSTSGTNVASSKAVKTAYDRGTTALDKANEMVEKANISDAIGSTSQTKVASSKAVKSAYDRGTTGINDAKSANDNAETKVAKTSISNSVTSESEATVASSKAAKTAYDRGSAGINAANAANDNAETKVAKTSISDSVTSDSTTTVASSKAVKTAMDKGNEALTEAGKKVDKTAISDSVTSSSATTVASSKAAKAAYDRGTEGINDAKSANDNANTRFKMHTGSASISVGNNKKAVSVFNPNSDVSAAKILITPSEGSSAKLHGVVEVLSSESNEVSASLTSLLGDDFRVKISKSNETAHAGGFDLYIQNISTATADVDITVMPYGGEVVNVDDTIRYGNLALYAHSVILEKSDGATVLRSLHGSGSRYSKFDAMLYDSGNRVFSPGNRNITSDIDNDSDTTYASANAVKSAYDKALEAMESGGGGGIGYVKEVAGGVVDFVVPDGVTSVKVTMVGAGGSGGGGCAYRNGPDGYGAGGGGGGGGGVIEGLILPVVPGDMLTLEAGLGGAAPGVGLSDRNGYTGKPGGDTAIGVNGRIVVMCTGGGGGGGGARAYKAHVGGGGGGAGGTAAFLEGDLDPLTGFYAPGVNGATGGASWGGSSSGGTFSITHPLVAGYGETLSHPGGGGGGRSSNNNNRVGGGSGGAGSYLSPGGKGGQGKKYAPGDGGAGDYMNFGSGGGGGGAGVGVTQSNYTSNGGRGGHGYIKIEF